MEEQTFTFKKASKRLRFCEWLRRIRCWILTFIILGVTSLPPPSISLLQSLRLDINPTQADAEPGTDVALMAEGYATVTALRSVSEAEVDLGGWVASA